MASNGVKNTNLSLNWEKEPFMVKEGIVLVHKISKKGIEVDKAKIDVIAKLPSEISLQQYSDQLTHLLEKKLHSTFRDAFGFPNMKNRLTEGSNLDCSNMGLPFELMCDAKRFRHRIALIGEDLSFLSFIKSFTSSASIGNPIS
ncbi:hypothetical protein Tco_0895497 [Tanacetum coccineum]|uniref:Uncharacterized protein n=1 Tax=Tanacetum coccineum TaxID=301880 RepID=A0ABQ5CES9_9ASTR